MVATRMRPAGRRGRGQALVEFALILPVLMLILGAVIQFGLIFWAQNTLTQVVRDTGRWAATQQGQCDLGGPALVAKADAIAQISSLMGYTAGQWNGNGIPYPADPQPREGVEVSWPISTDTKVGVKTPSMPPSNTEPSQGRPE